jgi:alpha-tubulin suppressor-like RCC1 family protein
MSELIDKFECLRKLNEEYKRNIKLFYACNGLSFNVIILTNDDMVYSFGDKNDWRLRLLNSYVLRNEFIIKELCHQRVIDFRNTLQSLFARTFDGKVYYWEFCEIKSQLIESLLNHNIIDVCCGNTQVIVLTDNGIVFTSDLFFGSDFKELNSNAFNG